MNTNFDSEVQKKIEVLKNRMSSGTVYCANDPCESEASYVILPSVTPLCYCCQTAYSWGAANQGSAIAIESSQD